MAPPRMPVPDTIRAEYLSGSTIDEIAVAHGISYGIVRRTLLRLGVERRIRGTRPTDPATRLFGLASPEPNSGCWIWTGCSGTENGYGYFALRRREGAILAHRASYEIHVGSIPDGLHIDHLCRNRLCVNPSHLEAVTQHENNRRAIKAKRAS